MDLKLPDGAAFLARLTASVHPPPSARDAAMTDGRHRYVLSGRIDSADIRMAVVRIPPRSGLFVFAPRFEGRIAEDGNRLVGRFRAPLPYLLLAAGLLLWGAFPGKAFRDTVVPLLGGTGILLGFAAFAVWQFRAYQRWMTRVLRDAAGPGGHRPRAVR